MQDKRRARGRTATLATTVAAVAAAVAEAVALVVPTATANDIAPFTTFFNTDVSQAGFGGMQGIGTGTMTVSGVSGTVTKAYPLLARADELERPVAERRRQLRRDSVGHEHRPLLRQRLGHANSQAYRADVTSLVTGNGTYSLANFRKTRQRQDQRRLADRLLRRRDPGNNRDVVMFDGNDSNFPDSFDADGWNVVLPGINYVDGSAASRCTCRTGRGTWTTH